MMLVVVMVLLLSAPQGVDAHKKAPTRVVPPPAPGALVRVNVQPSTIGITMDEIPLGSRQRLVNFITQQSDAWWEARVKQQLALTLFRLSFRSSYYPGKKQLILPSHFMINFTGPAVRDSSYEGGHDAVIRQYSAEAMIVSTFESPGISDPALKYIGGSVWENFTFPIDPQMVLQRTGYACMDEDQFPRNSVDSESVYVYYDDSCVAGQPDSSVNLGTCYQQLQGCHCTKGADLDCPASVQKNVGAIMVNISFTRTAWDEATATYWESLNNIEMQAAGSGTDLIGVPQTINHQWIIYRYYNTTSCEYLECLDRRIGDAWRRLLIFDSITSNRGDTTLNIGPVNYEPYFSASFNPATFGYEYYWDPW